MNNWIRFFIGTPQRFLVTAGFVGLVVVMIKPGLLQMAVNRLLAEISPLFGPIIQIAILIFAFKIIFSAFSGGKR